MFTMNALMSRMQNGIPCEACDLGAPRHARIATCISEIFIEIGDLLEQQQPELDAYLSSTERTVALFLQGLADRVDEPWTVDDMAHECGLGRTRFVHYCKQAVNLPPLEYLNQLRIAKATELLQGTDLRITDVAARSGFSSSQYSSTVFRRYTGLPPGAVRAGRTLGGATMRAG
jgi:AraC family L-rhamnose operon regulatory protein RhaS